jgi:1-phosphatidylinositol phosphodiesterase
MFNPICHTFVPSKTTATARHRRRSRPVLERLEDRLVPTVYLGSLQSWMGNLPDAIPLSQMSIPGTHDTMTDAFASSGDLAPFSQTQDRTLQQQLDAGIRYIDIRCGPTYTFTGLNTNDLGIYHGLFGTGQSFDTDVVKVCIQFLQAHPTETIVMSVKNDYTGSGALGALSDNQFASIFKNAIQLTPTRDWYQSNAVPILGDVRGRIVLLRRFADSAPAPGINATGWSDNATFSITPDESGDRTTLDVQDQYDPSDVNTKATAIHDMLQRALSSTAQATVNDWYINFLSAAYDFNSLKIIPRFWAHGTDGKSGLDDQLQSVLSTMHTGRVGTIVMDFPTRLLIARVIGENWPYVTVSANALPYGASATATLHTIDPSQTVTFNAGGNATFGAVSATHDSTGLFTAYTATVTPTAVGNVTISARIANQPALAPYPTLAVAADRTLVELGALGDAQYGQAVTFSARVVNTSGTAAVPTGAVQFMVDGSNFGSPVPVDATGRASLTIPHALSVGTHTVSATFTNSDGHFMGSQSTAHRLHVTPADVRVTLAGATVVHGQTAVWTATVAGVRDTLVPPTGSVQFAIDGHSVGAPVPLDPAGQAPIMLGSSLSVGRHTLRATYVNSDGNFVSPRVGVATLTVVARVPTQIALTSNTLLAIAGQTVTFTATVTPTLSTAAALTGTVEFMDGTRKLGTVKLNGGVATSSTAGLHIGKHAIEAIYLGDASFVQSVSKVVTQWVNVAVPS